MTATMLLTSQTQMFFKRTLCQLWCGGRIPTVTAL